LDAPVTQLRQPRLAAGSGKRAETKTRNRSVILEAARRVFAERGFGSATVRDVIRATPLAAATFYKYFRSKEEVLCALRDAAAENMRPALREARLAATTAQDFFAASFRVFFSYAATHPERFAAVRRSNALHVPLDASELAACMTEMRGDIEAAIARGVLPALDSAYLASAMQGVAFELAEVMLQREPPNPEAATAFATAIFMNGAIAEARAKSGEAAQPG
jgi:AcrR family transcriptional regulator